MRKRRVLNVISNLVNKLILTKVKWLISPLYKYDKPISKK